jgi:hypothetical protein
MFPCIAAIGLHLGNYRSKKHENAAVRLSAIEKPVKRIGAS